MKRVLAGILIAAAAAIAMAVGALLLVDADRFRPQVQDALASSLGRDVTLGKLGFSIWSGSLDASDIRIAEDPEFGKEAFVTAKALNLGIRLRPLLFRREVQVTSLSLEGPVVSLRQDSAGRWNFSSLAGRKATTSAASGGTTNVPETSIDALHVDGGQVEVTRASGKLRRYVDLRLDADGLRMNAVIPFSARAAVAGGGAIDFEGTFGPWNADDATLTPLDARLQLHGLDLAKAGLVSGDNDVGGVIDSDTRITSGNGELQSSGTIQARQLKLIAAGAPASEPLQITYHARYRLAARTGSIDKTAIGVGAARLAVDGKFDNRQERMRVDLKLRGQQLPVDGVQALLPAFGVVLPERSKLSGGHLGVELDARGRLDALTISGQVSLDNTFLEGFSLGSKLGTALSLAGIRTPRDTQIRHADAQIEMNPGGVTVDPLDAEIVDLGRILGRGRMSSDRSLDFRMRVTLDDAITAGSERNDLGALIGNLLKGTSGEGIGVRVTGTASNPRFKVDPAAILGLLGNGISAQRNGNPDNAEPEKPRRTEDLLKDLLRGALKPKNDDRNSPDQDQH